VQFAKYCKYFALFFALDQEPLKVLTVEPKSRFFYAFPFPINFKFHNVYFLHKHLLQQPLLPLHCFFNLAAALVYLFVEGGEEVGDFGLFDN